MKSQKSIVLITGVSRQEGLGFGIARAMKEQGFEVVVSARKKKQAEALAKELSDKKGTVVAEQLDITNQESVEALVDFIKEKYQKLDVLINNAGAELDYGTHPLETDFDTTRAMFETNLFGTWRMVKHFYPLLKRSDHPRIVNVSSGAGSFGDPQFGLSNHPAVVTSYGISKLALNGLTVKLARQLKDDGILVNAVDPGLTATAPGMEDMGARPVSESAEGIVWVATLPDDGPSGGFFRDKEPMPW